MKDTAYMAMRTTPINDSSRVLVEEKLVKSFREDFGKIEYEINWVAPDYVEIRQKS